MGRTTAETIKEITRNHLINGNGLLFGQCVTAVGWVGGTIPDCEGIVEIPMTDIAGPGFAVGAALIGRRPIFVVRYQGFMWYNASSFVNYAAKSKEVWGKPCPIFIRSIAMEGNGIENVLEFVGQALPDMYSAELSLFVLDAGIKLLEERKPEILYLSLTDFVQHAHAPGSNDANHFYIEMDKRFGRLQELGALVALTADHGMGDKSDESGKPNVIWLQDLLNQKLGFGACRVICPITDAFVGHHGALGGFVRIYLQKEQDRNKVSEIVKKIEGVENVWTAENVAKELEQPLDREGDLAVVADKKTVIGGSEKDHNLSALKGKRLRTHGSLHEAMVPFILSEPLNESYLNRAKEGTLRSREIFEYALNGTK